LQIPKEVKIGGGVYKIEMVDNCEADDRNTAGIIQYSKNLIQLRKDIYGDYLDYVFIHELFHGIYEHCGFEQNENEVDRLSRALHMVIKDNPNIFTKG
jgi:hypothetical protein